MNGNLVIYRCCDRPKYVERTWPHLVEHTDEDSFIVMVDNSGDPANRRKHQKTFHVNQPKHGEFIHVGERVGGWPAMNMAIRQVGRHHDPVAVMIADDDCLVPVQEHKWDWLLRNMIDSDLWDVVGFDNGDPCTPTGQKRGYELKGDGLERGRIRRYVGGACSAFRYSLYEETFDPVELSLFWFTLWTTKYAGDPQYQINRQLDEGLPHERGGAWLYEGRCGHFAGYTITNFLHLDKIEGESLQDEYAEYTDYMRRDRHYGTT